MQPKTNRQTHRTVTIRLLILSSTQISFHYASLFLPCPYPQKSPSFVGQLSYDVTCNQVISDPGVTHRACPVTDAAFQGVHMYSPILPVQFVYTIYDPNNINWQQEKIIFYGNVIFSFPSLHCTYAKFTGCDNLPYFQFPPTCL